MVQILRSVASKLIHTVIHDLHYFGPLTPFSSRGKEFKNHF